MPRQGCFDQQEETLGLDGDVKVDSSLGYKLHTDKVAGRYAQGLHGDPEPGQYCIS